MRDAWCVACDGVVAADEDGCIRCQGIAVVPREEQRTLSTNEHAVSMRALRKQRRESRQCINGALHPQPRKGECRCDWCKDVHQRGLEAVLKKPKHKRPTKKLIWRRA